MELTRHGHLAWCCLVRAPPWVWVYSLGMGHLHAMRWSSVTLLAKLGKVLSRSLSNPSSQSSRLAYRSAADSTIEC